MKTLFVNRERATPLPEWAYRWLTPELHETGPTEIALTDICSFSSIRQDETIEGFTFYEHLCTNGLLERCLNLQDGLAIKSDPSLPLSPYFTDGGRLLLWKSVLVGDKNPNSKNLLVPFVQVISGQTPIIYYWWLAYNIRPKSDKGLLRVA